LGRGHGGGEDGDVELDLGGELDAYIGFIRQYLGIARDDENIVKGKGVKCVEKLLVHTGVSFLLKVPL